MVYLNKTQLLLLFLLLRSLAVTNRVENAIAMGIGVTFVIMASSALVSLLRNLIPPKVRMVAYMVIISVFTISFKCSYKVLPNNSASLGAPQVNYYQLYRYGSC